MRLRLPALAIVAALAALSAPPPAPAQPSYEAARRGMVANVRQLAAAGALGPARRLDGRVLEAMREVPRHRFVPDEMRRYAYDDTPLPIGHDSTISQPFIVALMTDLLEVKPGQKVLEVGTGSGYQAAILSKLSAKVFTVEIVPELARGAEQRLAEMGYEGVQVRAGDGYKGWPEAAPFDGVLVTAGATHIPKPLVDQLAPGGRLVIPVGLHDGAQQLTLVTKDARGRTRTTRLGRVAFIPLDERAQPRD